MRLKRALGFTIVELVVVMVLIGALSVTAMSRFVKPDAFAPIEIASTVQAQAHYAAQSAQTSAGSIALRLAAVGNTWQIDVRRGAVSLRSSSVDAANTRIEVANNGNLYDVDASAPLTLMFAGAGDLSSGVLGVDVLDAQSGVEVRTIGDTTQFLCFYPTGYASARPC